MAITVKLNQSKPLNKISREVEALVEAGEGRVVFEFYGSPSYKQIVKTLEWLGDEHARKLSISHAGFKDYIAHAAAGAAVGGVTALLLKLSGIAISGPMAAALTLLLAAWVLLATTLHVRLYKYRGNTRLSVVV